MLNPNPSSFIFPSWIYFLYWSRLFNRNDFCQPCHWAIHRKSQRQIYGCQRLKNSTRFRSHLFDEICENASMGKYFQKKGWETKGRRVETTWEGKSLSAVLIKIIPIVNQAFIVSNFR